MRENKTDEMLACVYTCISDIAVNAVCDSKTVLSELSLFCGKLGIFSTNVIWQTTHTYVSWKGLVSSTTPQLVMVSSNNLQILSTTAASERNWSIYSNVQSKSRSRLTAKRAKITCLPQATHGRFCTRIDRNLCQK